METTKLSSKGQVIIPKRIRETHHWDVGTELEVIALEGGVFLKSKAPFEKTAIDDVAGCLQYTGASRTDKDIQAALKQAARKAWRDSN